MDIGVGRQWTVDTVMKAWCQGDATWAGMGWVMRVAREDLVLANIIGRCPLRHRLMLTLLRCETGIGYGKAQDPLAFTWRGADTSNARSTCQGGLLQYT